MCNCPPLACKTFFYQAQIFFVIYYLLSLEFLKQRLLCAHCAVFSITLPTSACTVLQFDNFISNLALYFCTEIYSCKYVFLGEIMGVSYIHGSCCKHGKEFVYDDLDKMSSNNISRTTKFENTQICL